MNIYFKVLHKYAKYLKQNYNYILIMLYIMILYILIAYYI